MIASAHALYHLGHVRAPTTKISNFSGCHPFQYGRAIAAHNGIITNTLNLETKEAYQPEVDSEWIPFLYNKPQTKFVTAFGKFQSALERLEGTYGTWLHDTSSRTILVGRGDNTIYWNADNTMFSSKAISNYGIENLMHNGSIYMGCLGDNSSPRFSDVNVDNRIQRKPKYFIPN